MKGRLVVVHTVFLVQLNSSSTSELTQTPPCTHLTASSLGTQLAKTLKDVFPRKYC